MRLDQKDAEHGHAGNEQKIAGVARSKDRPRHVDAVVAAGADLAEKSGSADRKADDGDQSLKCAREHQRDQRQIKPAHAQRRQSPDHADHRGADAAGEYGHEERRMDVVIDAQADPAADADQRPLAKRYQAELPIQQRAAEHGQRHAIGLGEIRQPITAAVDAITPETTPTTATIATARMPGVISRGPAGADGGLDGFGLADFGHSRAPTPWPAPTIIRKIRAAI